jgi:hypothetical protein
MLCLILIVGGLLIMMGQHDRSENGADAGFPPPQSYCSGAPYNEVDLDVFDISLF